MWGRGMRWVGAALALGVASAATAQEAGQEQAGPMERAKASTAAGTFGEKGQLVLNQELQLNLVYNTAGADTVSIIVSPGADYFVRENVSLGAVVNFGQLFQPGEDATSIGGSVRLGYNMAYDERISFWPRVSAGVIYNKTATFLFGAEGTFFQLGAYVPALYHPTSHFFVGFGPNVDLQLGDSSGLSFGLRSIVGGYF